MFKAKEYSGIKLNIVKNNYEFPLLESVSKYVSKSKPELLIMFTKREKSFFESIFLPSKSAELTYTTKIPVLIYSNNRLRVILDGFFMNLLNNNISKSA